MPSVDRLRAGQDFGNVVKRLFESKTSGLFSSEFGMVLTTGRRGIADVWIPSDASSGEVAILEVKATDWDLIPPLRVRRNVRRQARQVWSYAHSAMTKQSPAFPVVQLFMVFPRKPIDEALQRVIEVLFMEHGVLVHWLETEETTPSILMEVAEEGANSWSVLCESGLVPIDDLETWRAVCVTGRAFRPL